MREKLTELGRLQQLNSQLNSEVNLKQQEIRNLETQAQEKLF
jgi:hypothetical protein